MSLHAADVAVVIGPATGHLYAGYDTGQTWNGSPVIAFTHPQLQALIEHGDGTDANGHGLTYDLAHGFTDTTSDTEREPVPARSLTDLDGDQVDVYIPAGRIWDLDHGQGGPSLYNDDLECTACGTHLANPHQPTCPTTDAQLQHDISGPSWPGEPPITAGGPAL